MALVSLPQPRDKPILSLYSQRSIPHYLNLKWRLYQSLHGEVGRCNFTPHSRDLVESPISPLAPAVFSDLCFCLHLFLFSQPLFKTCPFESPRQFSICLQLLHPLRVFQAYPCVPSPAADWPQALLSSLDRLLGEIIDFFSLLFPSNC